jgi:hypothetical protein
MNLFEMFEQGPPEPTLIDALRDFLPIAIEHLKLDHIPKIKLVKEIHDTHVPTFGRFVNDDKVIYVVVNKRNPVDVLRTLAHELVHYQQGEEHRLDQDSGNTGSPIEDEANAEGGVIMRLFNQAHPNYMLADPIEVAESKQRLDPKCWKGYKKQGTKMKGDTRVNNCVPIEESYDGDEFFEAYGELWYNEDEQLDEAEYHGHKVPLGKPMQGDVKKFKVYVKDPSTGNIKKVNFGDPNMRIKKSNPARRKSFRARHNCANPGPRTKARYWSCRKW